MRTDLTYAKHVEVLVDDQNKVWLNIDGQCVARIGCAENLRVEVAGDHEATHRTTTPSADMVSRAQATTIERHYDY